MDHYIIGCDAHKYYSQFDVFNTSSQAEQRLRVEHTPQALRSFLAQFPKGTPVALESVGNWYWIVDEIEAAGCIPLMAHAAKAKVMMGNVNKSDKLDAKGLLTLLRNGTLPTVWLPPAAVRDERELPRTRMSFCKQRTALKNRIQATLAKYALSPQEGEDLFTSQGRAWLNETIQKLPAETRRCVQQELETLDHLQGQINQLERRIRDCVALTPEMQLLKSLPGIGDILAIVVAMEAGEMSRFPSPEHFASYSGTVPKVKSSGGRTRYGHMRQEANRYLKWAFFEAANAVVSRRHHPLWRNRHVVRLYERLRQRKGHAVAAGAVARHLAEAAYWVLRKNEPYREPISKKGLSKQG